MVFLVLLGTFIILFILYLVYSSYFFQLILFKHLNKDLVEDIILNVGGNILNEGYFSSHNHVLDIKNFNKLLKSEKLKYDFCYNIIRFNTENASWEIFFHLVKINNKYSQIMSIRTFSKFNHIKSEGNIDMNHSRLNILTNNRYFSELLERGQVNHILCEIISKNLDTMVINYNSIHFKTILDDENIFDIDRIITLIDYIKLIKNNVYKPGVLEY